MLRVALKPKMARRRLRRLGYPRPEICPFKLVPDAPDVEVCVYIAQPSLNVIISLTPSLNRSHVQKLLTAKTVSTANAAKDTIAEIDIQLVRMGLCIAIVVHGYQIGPLMSALHIFAIALDAYPVLAFPGHDDCTFRY